MLARGPRKALLSVHLVASVGWIGAVAAYLSLGISAATSTDTMQVRAAWLAMETIGWVVIVPLAMATVVTGVALSLATRWGLFRYYWVVVALVVSILCTVVLLLHMPDVTLLAERAQTMDGEHLDALGGDLVHASVGMVLLLLVLVLNVYKPPGLTRYGWRRQRAS